MKSSMPSPLTSPAPLTEYPVWSCAWAALSTKPSVPSPPFADSKLDSSNSAGNGDAESALLASIAMLAQHALATLTIRASPCTTRRTARRSDDSEMAAWLLCSPLLIMKILPNQGHWQKSCATQQDA